MSTQTPRVLVDEAVHAPHVFAAFGEVETRPGAQLIEGDLRGVRAIVTRTATQISAQVLARAPDLRAVGSASAGFDHIDRNALAEAGVAFAHAPGCNASAVAQWVIAALLRAGTLTPHGGSLRCAGPVGIVGAGAVGRALHETLTALGIECRLCDPPRHARGLLAAHASLDQLVDSCEVLSFHVPLTRTGPHATAGMFGATQVRQWLRAGKSLVNASRGDVLVLPPAQALDQAAGRLVLDVWPGEPDLDWRWLQADARPRCLALATPHVAGYSLEGKRRATQAVAQAFATHFECTAPRLAPAPEPVPIESGEPLELLPRLCRLAADDAALCALVDIEAGAARASGWRALRSQYPLRREFGSIRAPRAWNPQFAAALGFLPAQ